MIKTKPKIRIIFGTALCLLLAAAVLTAKVTTRAGDMMATQEEMLLKCYFNGKASVADLTPDETRKMGALRVSPYADWDKSPSTIIDLYHENMNERFNEYIKKMLAATKECAKVQDPEAPCNKNSRPPPRKADGTIEKCSPENFSTYCVATTLYSDTDIGFITLRDILNCRKFELFEQASKGTVWNDWMTWNNSATVAFQENKAINASNKASVIDARIAEAKKALDTTLSAYDQLRSAWLMHKRYMRIYWSLLKYRDKLVEIRRAVETFPAKFIDASTTRCK